MLVLKDHIRGDMHRNTEEDNAAANRNKSATRLKSGSMSGASSGGRRVISCRGEVRCLHLSIDGSRLITGSSARYARMWKVDDGSVMNLHSLGVAGSDVLCVHMTPDESYIFTGDSGGYVLLWDAVVDPTNISPKSAPTTMIKTPRDAIEINAPRTEQEVNAVKRFQTAMGKKNMEQEELIAAFKCDAAVQCLLVSRGSDELFTGSKSKKARRWVVGPYAGRNVGERKRLLHTVSDREYVCEGEVFCMALSSDERTLFTGDRSKKVVLWDVDQGEVKHTIFCDGYVWALTLSADGKSLFTGGESKKIIQWSTEDWSRQMVMECKAGVRCLQLDKTEQLIFAGDHSGTVYLWDVESGEQTQTLAISGDVVWCLQLSADGKKLVTGDSDQKATIWNVSSCQRTLRARCRGAINTLLLTKGADLLFSGDDTGHVTAWDLKKEGQGRREPAFTEKDVGLRIKIQGHVVYIGDEAAMEQRNPWWKRFSPPPIDGGTIERVNQAIGGWILVTLDSAPDAEPFCFRNPEAEDRSVPVVKSLSVQCNGSVRCIELSADENRLFVGDESGVVTMFRRSGSDGAGASNESSFANALCFERKVQGPAFRHSDESRKLTFKDDTTVIVDNEERKVMWQDGPPILGAKWRYVGHEKPKMGNEIFSTELATTLQQKHTLGKEEVDRLKLKDELTANSFIKVGNVYFEQAAPLVPVGSSIEFAAEVVGGVVNVKGGFGERQKGPVTFANPVWVKEIPEGHCKVRALRYLEKRNVLLTGANALLKWTCPEPDAPMDALTAYRPAVEVISEENFSRKWVGDGDVQSMLVNKAETQIFTGHEVPMRKAGVILGSKWKQVGNETPSVGEEISCPELATALLKKHEFSKEDVDGFDLKDRAGRDTKLKVDSFIKVGNEYFSQAGVDCPSEHEMGPTKLDR